MFLEVLLSFASFVYELFDISAVHTLSFITPLESLFKACSNVLYSSAQADQFLLPLCVSVCPRMCVSHRLTNLYSYCV